MVITLKRAVAEDAQALIALLNLSFYDDYIKYGVCPGYNRTVESMAESITQHQVYQIICDNAPVGVIIVRVNGALDYHLGCLCVIPAYQNKGIGQFAMRALEEYYPDAAHWSLDTPADKAGNLYFYQKHGFHVTKQYAVEGVTLAFLEKGHRSF